MPKKIVKIYTYIIRSECVNDIIHNFEKIMLFKGFKNRSKYIFVIFYRTCVNNLKAQGRSIVNSF